MPTQWPKKKRLIGTRVSRLDGPAKATGRAKYSYDMNRPGMLHGDILRCKYAHARIKSLDTSAAMRMPGVKAVYLFGVAYEGLFAKADGTSITVLMRPVDTPAALVRAGVAKVRKGGKDEEVTLDSASDTRYVKDLKMVKASDLKADDKFIIRKFTEKVVPIETGTRLYKEGKAAKVSDFKTDDRIMVESEKDAVGRELSYAGDEVVALCADTEEHAADALRAIKIEYDVLEHIVREEDSLKDPSKKTVAGPGNSNVIAAGKEYTKGDVDSAYGAADAVVTGTYGAAVICHQCLEPHGLVAEWGADGGLTVWASTQATVSTAGALAGVFAVPPAKVKCITHHMGGGYGSKFGPDVQGIAAAALALRAGAPVKIMLDRAAEVTTAGNRPSVYCTVKIAGKKDGSITAFEVDCYWTSGFAGGATVNLGLLPYVYLDAVPNIKRKHSVVRVNAGGARAMRAPGHPQNCILTEAAVDDLAAKLGIDPLVIRRKNLPPKDDAAMKVNPLSFVALRNKLYNDQLDLAVKLSHWSEKWHAPGQGPSKGPVKFGIGMAMHTWGGFAAGGDPPPNECTVTIGRDGSVTAEASTQDLGTGQRTVNAIVVAETLGLEVADVNSVIGDTQYGRSTGSGGSTTCPSQAPAALRAAIAARDDLFAKVGKKLGVDPKNLEVQVGKVVDTAKKQEWSWKEFCARLGMDSARGRGEWSANFNDPKAYPDIAGLSAGQVGGVQTAEVSVDVETGVVKIIHMVAVQDCGLIINKLGCESQVAGGVIMGLNYALFEERIMDRVTGRQVNPDMEFYKLGGLRDMPKITVEMMDMPERGVIGIGEPPTISTAAAIGNAVFNAIGVRVPILPLTPQRVLEALAKGGKS